MRYRECYEDGDPNNKKLYEFDKWCECRECRIRSTTKGEPPNYKEIITDNLDNREVIEKDLKAWVCEDGTKRLPIVSVRLMEVER